MGWTTSTHGYGTQMHSNVWSLYTIWPTVCGHLAMWLINITFQIWSFFALIITSTSLGRFSTRSWSVAIQICASLRACFLKNTIYQTTSLHSQEFTSFLAEAWISDCTMTSLLLSAALNATMPCFSSFVPLQIDLERAICQIHKKEEREIKRL